MRNGPSWSPFYRRPAHAGANDAGQCGASSRRSSTCCARVARGRCCRTAFRPLQRCIAGLRVSAMTERGRRSTTIWSCVSASVSDARPVRRPRCWIARAPRPRKRAAHVAMTRARRSKAASGTRWSTPMGERSKSTCTRPIPRIAMAPWRCCRYLEHAGLVALRVQHGALGE